MMPARNRAARRGQLIFDYLSGRMDAEFSISDLGAVLGFNSTATTRSAIRYAAELAHHEGLYVTVPCPANNFMVCMTVMAGKAIRPTTHLERIRSGVGKRSMQGMAILRQGRDTLSADEKDAADLLIACDDAQQAHSKIIEAALKVLK